MKEDTPGKDKACPLVFERSVETPEIKVAFDNREVRSSDYGWEGHDFVVVENETGKKYVFKNAYLTRMFPETVTGGDSIKVPMEFFK